MRNCTRIAIKKLNDLIGQDDFVEILSIDASGISIKFSSSRCKIDKDGRVTWNH